MDLNNLLTRASLAAVLASCVVGFSTAATSPPQGGDAYEQYFPFSATEQRTVMLVPLGNVVVCSANPAGCKTITMPNELATTIRVVAGPFVKNSHASWLALSKDRISICYVAIGAKAANCLPTRVKMSGDIKIGFARAGVSPRLRFTSNTIGSLDLISYAKAVTTEIEYITAKLEKAMQAEPETDDPGMSPLSEENIVDVPGTPLPPSPGSPPGTVDIPIWGGGGSDNGGGSGTDPGDGPGCSSTPGSTPTAQSATTAAAGSCPATKEEYLRRCFAATEQIYYDVHVPACQRAYPRDTQIDRERRALCYSDAIERMVEGKRQCQSDADEIYK
ncbi:hypothetical protein [Massilia sp. Root418]|uniref:hypothetical protein n=1 Tax=Massilia sp. Root418 TaxID=1736532 RepID=UPI000B2F68FB|nr:hypothetical protein [Massilia sp. Root418]